MRQFSLDFVKIIRLPLADSVRGFYFIAVVIVDFLTMLIGAEGAETPAGVRGRGGSPARPRKAKRLERKSTDKFNKA